MPSLIQPPDYARVRDTTLDIPMVMRINEHGMIQSLMHEESGTSLLCQNMNISLDMDYTGGTTKIDLSLIMLGSIYNLVALARGIRQPRAQQPEQSHKIVTEEISDTRNIEA